ncbi:LysR family transcriptional regulator [Paraburkholderia sp.]|uniref:LysR family transcriptional regulator n=1 Tax=Paraburkholderia sp. TaxID=1926495 RepID=UPI002392D792|nr:LysR family transcriptional regulator [Paraburkholderia sp.]MDE1182365.1 LysR family transcriptional regulator [Paraburkholderia sp.]
MRFDLTDLRLFVTVVELGSLTRGAQAMNLALASVSERVSGMEAALGTALLERGRRGVQPTAAGNALVRHARLILGQVEHMRGEMHAYASGLKGRVELLSNTAALVSFLPSRLQRFLAAYPDLSVDIDERPSQEIVRAVAEGSADIGLVADITDLASLQTHLLAQDQLVVIADRAHRIAALSQVAFAEIVDDAFIGLKDAVLETHLAYRASRLGRQIEYRVQLRSIEHVARMVEANIGLAILSEASAAQLREPALAIVRLSDPWATRRLYLCARDFTTLTPHAKLLVSHLIDLPDDTLPEAARA